MKYINLAKKFINNNSDIQYDFDFVMDIIVGIVPFNSNENKWYRDILIEKRCNTVEEYKSLFIKIREFPNKRHNKEWYELLYNKSWDDFIATKTSKFRKTLNDNYSIGDTHREIAHNFHKKYNVPFDIMLPFIKSVYPYPENDRPILISMFTNIKYDRYQEYIEHYEKIKACTNRTENIEWLTLTKGYEKAVEHMNRKGDRVRGDKNFFHNHGGKYSIWSSNCLYEYDTGDLKKKFSKRQSNNVNNVFSRAHYDSDEEYLKFQSKDITYYIDKYGVENGLKVYNKKKMIWSFSRVGMDYTDLKTSIKEYGDDKCIMYVLKISENVIKVGITTTSVYRRYSGVESNYEILAEYKSTLLKCLEMELEIKNKFYMNNIKRSEAINGFGVTECYSASILDVILCTIRKGL